MKDHVFPPPPPKIMVVVGHIVALISQIYFDP